MKIRETADTDDPDWLALRSAFIPELDPSEQPGFLALFAAASAGFSAFVAHAGDGAAIGFAEVSVRTDYVNGCRYRPALFLEGIYVKPGYRGRGVARALCAAAEVWGRAQGCREFASDVTFDDHDSLAAHAGLGFEETERVVYFRKELFPG
jgi:aminoglycoside 6'-N-acetyltransferase I